MPARNDDSGQYVESFPLAEFIQALQILDGDVGTKDVEQVVGCKYRTAIAKLHELEDRGVVTSRKVGNAYLWSLAESEQSEPDDQNTESRERGGESTDSTEDGEEYEIEGGIYQPTSEHQ